MRVWTQHYNAFVMGGSCWQDMATEINVDGAPVYEIAEGLYVLELVHEKVGTVFVDLISGGFVGDDLAQMRSDTAERGAEKVREDCLKMKVRAADAPLLDEKDFWSKFKGKR